MEELLRGPRDVESDSVEATELVERGNEAVARVHHRAGDPSKSPSVREARRRTELVLPEERWISEKRRGGPRRPEAERA